VPGLLDDALTSGQEAVEFDRRLIPINVAAILAEQALEMVERLEREEADAA
jgi:hypothetical protein